MTDIPVTAASRIEPGDTPELTAARWMANFWQKTFNDPVTEKDFTAQAARIVKEVRPQITKEALEEVRQWLANAKTPDGKPLIDTLYWAAGEAKLAGTPPLEKLLGAAADLLAKIWVRANDGTLVPPNWMTERQELWTDRRS